MESKNKRLLEKLEADFDQLSSCEKWDKNQIELMKDLQKLMYYIEVRDAMKTGGEYPGSEYMEDDGESRRSYTNIPNLPNMNSYTRSMPARRANGQFMSGHYPMNGNGNWYYDGGMSGRRYLDSEKENAVHYLHRILDSETRPEMVTAMQNVIRELEMK